MTRNGWNETSDPLLSIDSNDAMTQRHSMVVVTFMIFVVIASDALAETQVRIKDISTFAGVRSNRLEGIGLVVGLNGTGGKAPFTRQVFVNAIQRFGMRFDAQQRLNLVNDALQKTENMAVVAVSAKLPPFARVGSHLDVKVSSMDDSTSLVGGELLSTTLYGIDDKPYATASGNVNVGGFVAEGAGASVQKNHPTAGIITNGAIVEESLGDVLGKNGHFRLVLQHHDPETARRVTEAINAAFPLTARTIDPRTIDVSTPGDRQADFTGFIADVGQIKVQPDHRARVVINARTGTVIFGHNVRVSKVVISHGNLSVATLEQPLVSQPEPFSDGVTTVVPNTQIDVVEDNPDLSVVDSSATVGDLATALNALGVTPRDLGVVFQHLHKAGALHAELEFE